MKKIFIIAAVAAALFACKSNEPENQTSEISTGALSGVFSVSPNKKVHFSKGNLQYQASTKTWRFAEQQFDYIGENNAKISATYSGWIDLFGWGTSGYQSQHPYMTVFDPTSYGEGDSDINGTQYDWGVHNAISNGGNKPGLWRTLTSRELDYLLNSRKNAKSLRAPGSINGIKGLFLLPDDFQLPSDVTFVWEAESESPQYKNNRYSLHEWYKMEDAGAVFLPACGARGRGEFDDEKEQIDIKHIGKMYSYWTSSHASYYGAFSLYGEGYYDPDCVLIDNEFYRSNGLAVRLVRDAQ